MQSGQIHEFDSDKLAVDPDEDEQTSYRVYGRALAKLLATRLRATEIIPKPFGWCVLLAREPFALWVACSNVDGGTSRWSARVVAEPSLIQSTFGRAEVDAAVAAADERLAMALAQVS